MGRCPDCKEWNSLVEQPVESSRPAAVAASISRPTPIGQVEEAEQPRRPTGIGELDRVLGGGVVDGSVVLLAGDPGIGKSTLVLQAVHHLVEGGGLALYVSGEESSRQLRLRAGRLGTMNGNLLVVAETEIEAIEAHIADIRPAAVVIDSIQTMYSPQLESGPGTVSQIRYSATRLIQMAKQSGVAVFLVGHVTKEGAIAGPKVLEHMVDTVLYLEGERHLSYRLLRATKNRFGSTNELGVFEMQETGLAEVPNASAAFLMERRAGNPGSAVVVTVEGSRPLLVEVQVLVCTAPAFGSPRRSTTGVDYYRAGLVLGVLEKRARIPLAQHDVYVNVPGGVKVTEPAVDLGIAVALASSAKEKPVRADTACFGEVGLTGEVRGVGQPDRRVSEAKRLGFSRCVAPRAGWSRGGPPEGVVVVEDLAGAFQAALES